MARIFWIGAIFAAVVVMELLFTALMPFFSGIAFDVAANTTVANYGSAKAVMQASPWWVYLLPVVIGTIGIIGVLRAKK